MSAWELAEQYYQEAYRLQMSGEYDRAIELYQRSIEACPTAEAHTFMGWTYSHKGDYDAAIQACHAAIATDPTLGNPYNDIGAYLMEIGRYDEAIPWFQKATEAERYEAYHYPHYNLGRIYESQGRYVDAIRELKSALEHAPAYPSAQKSLLRLMALAN